MIIISQTQIKIKLWHVYTLLLCFLSQGIDSKHYFLVQSIRDGVTGHAHFSQGLFLTKIKTCKSIAYGTSFQGCFESRNRFQALFFSIVHQGQSYRPRPVFTVHIFGKLKHANVWHKGPVPTRGFLSQGNRNRFQALFFSLIYMGWSYGPRPFFSIIAHILAKAKTCNLYIMAYGASYECSFELSNRFQE